MGGERAINNGIVLYKMQHSRKKDFKFQHLIQFYVFFIRVVLLATYLSTFCRFFRFAYPQTIRLHVYYVGCRVYWMYEKSVKKPNKHQHFDNILVAMQLYLLWMCWLLQFNLMAFRLYFNETAHRSVWH